MRRRLSLLVAVAALISLNVVPAASSTSAGLSSPEDALQRVLDQLLENRTEGKRIFVSLDCFPPGTPIESWKDVILTTTTFGWVVFIDDMPAANWEHPARYVFVERDTGRLYVYPSAVPFKDEDGYREHPTRMQRLILGAQEHRLSFDHVPKPPPRDAGANWAVLMSGGGSMMTNYVRYWNDLANIYIGLTKVYGYDDEKIVVLCSDGLDPAPDRANGTSSPPDLDGDGDDDINFPCTLEYVEFVFDRLREHLTAEDQLFVFTTDHGGGMLWNVHLNLWNYQRLEDWDLRDMVDALPQCDMIFTMEQCTSGGFIDDLCWDHDGRVFSAACEYDQPSFAMAPLYEYDAYVFHWTAAVRWEDAYGNPVDADRDRDGFVDMQEAFLYAKENDRAPERPQYDDRPRGLGKELDLYADAPLGTIEGYVTDASTGLGIEGQVKAPMIGRLTDCDTTGYYFLVTLAGLTYDLEATCFGHYVYRDTISVPEDSTVRLDFQLDPIPTGTIEGTVIESTTLLPLENAEVTILETPLDPVHTDPQGFYTIDVPGYAVYDLCASAYGHKSQVTTGVYVLPESTVTLEFVLDPCPGILIWDAALFPISGEAQQAALAAYGFESVVSSQLLQYGDLSYFDALYVNLGVWPTNYFIPEGSEEALALIAYIQSGGNLYLEGADVWYFDPAYFGHDLAPWFSIHPTNDGMADLYTVSGRTNTIMPELAGMSFEYIGGNEYIDHIKPTGHAELVFRNPDNLDPLGVANANVWGGHTLGTSFEFGGLVDGQNTKEEVMAAIIDFFDIGPEPDVSLVLEPDALIHAPGELLGFIATVTNNTQEMQSFYAIGEVTLPNGNPYARNPVLGPQHLTLDPGASVTTHLEHSIPYAAPYGMYTYTGTVGLPPDIVIDSDTFEFYIMQ